MARSASVERRTRETVVKVNLILGPGDVKVNTPIRFLNHMLETLMMYMNASGSIEAEELKPFNDDHHVVEDVAITLGAALDKALGDRAGIRRFGWAIVPMDDSLALASVDLGGRVYWVFKGSFSKDRVGDLSTEMIPHFVGSLASSSRSTIHAWILWGENTHHMVEALFKALGLALGQAVQEQGGGVLSTKGVVEWGPST